jgi:hypothetical protein
MDGTTTSTSTANTWFQAQNIASEDAWLELFARYRDVGDPLADEALASARDRGALLRHPVEELEAAARAGNAVAIALLDELSTVPKWVDFNGMRRGGAMAQRNFPLLIAALTYGALPLVFAHPDSAAVFAGTGHFAASIPRRLNESATLFFGVTNSEELRPRGAMWVACLRVRLIHAVIRAQFRAKATWDSALRGVPVSALQTAAGPAFFGTHMLACLRALGAAIEEEEAVGHNVTWRYVTYLLGVPPELLGATQRDQDAFDTRLLALAVVPDETSRKLVAALLDGLCSSPPTGRIPRATQIALMRTLLGERWADAFGIPPADPRAFLRVRTVMNAYSRLASSALTATATERLGKRALSRLATEGLVQPIAGDVTSQA